MNATTWIVGILFAALMICIILLSRGCGKLPDNAVNKKFVDSITQKEAKDSLYAHKYKDSTDKAIAALRQSNDSLEHKQKVSEGSLNKEARNVRGLLVTIDSLKNAHDTVDLLQACADLGQRLLNDSALLLGYQYLSDSLITRLKMERGQSDTVKNNIFTMFSEANSSLFEVSRKYGLLNADYLKAVRQAKKRIGVGPSIDLGLVGGKIAVFPGIGIHYDLFRF